MFSFDSFFFFAVCICVFIAFVFELKNTNFKIIKSSPASPLSILNASPLGHIPQAQSPTQTNGLLSLADNNNMSPHNGHARLVCILIIFFYIF